MIPERPISNLHNSEEVTLGSASTCSMTAAVGAETQVCGGRCRFTLRGNLHQPRHNHGLVISFADGTSGEVYRETAVAGHAVKAPVYLAVTFRLRAIGGRRWAHALFRAESLLNTVLFAGFQGLISKLWLRHDQSNRYRGLYQWDGSTSALRYVNALWWVLAMVSDPASIEYVIIPGFECDRILAEPSLFEGLPGGDQAWWRPISSVSSPNAKGRPIHPT